MMQYATNQMGNFELCLELDKQLAALNNAKPPSKFMTVFFSWYGSRQY